MYWVRSTVKRWFATKLIANGKATVKGTFLVMDCTS